MLFRNAASTAGLGKPSTDDAGLARGAARACAMVGRVGVEPTTSRLSGVRSNHLSYRPHPAKLTTKAAGGDEPAQAHVSEETFSRMKGHEDGGNVL